MLRNMCKKFTKWGLSRMRNRDWLNNMALIDMLSYISDHIEECLVYRIENWDIEKIEDCCEKYEWDCYKCIAAWLNEKH